MNEHGKVEDLGELPVQNEAIVLFDSTGYIETVKAKTPNINKLGKIQKAYSSSYYTPPSVHAMLRGNFPQPEGRCWWPMGRYSNVGEHGFTPVKLGNLGYHTYLISNNILIDDTHYVGKDCIAHTDYFKNYICDWDDGMSSRKLINKFLNQLEEPFYAFFIFVETHTPYLNQKGAMRRSNKGQIKAIEYLDGSLGILMNGLKSKKLKHKTRVIMSADHAEAWDSSLVSHGHNPTNYHKFLKMGLLRRLLTVPLVVGKI